MNVIKLGVPVCAEDAFDLREGFDRLEADVALEVLLVGGGGELELASEELDAGVVDVTAEVLQVSQFGGPAVSVVRGVQREDEVAGLLGRRRRAARAGRVVCGHFRGLKAPRRSRARGPCVCCRHARAWPGRGGRGAGLRGRPRCVRG